MLKKNAGAPRGFIEALLQLPMPPMINVDDVPTNAKFGIIQRIIMRLVIFIIVIILALLGISHYKNSFIAKELTKELDKNPAITQKEVTCSGFIKSDCTITEPKVNALVLSDSVTIEGIDPTVMPKEGEFKPIKLKIEAKGVRYSLWDFLKKNPLFGTNRDFFQKYGKKYDVDADFVALSDGKTVRSIDVVRLKADDKMLPFELSTKADSLDKELVLKHLDINLNLSKKREIFNDFITIAKKNGTLPPQMASKSNQEIISEISSMMLRNSTSIRALDEVTKALLDANSTSLSVKIDAKSDTPISKMLIPLVLSQGGALEEFFDIEVKAK